jgi:hypothetical protein
MGPRPKYEHRTFQRAACVLNFELPLCAQGPVVLLGMRRFLMSAVPLYKMECSHSEGIGCEVEDTRVLEEDFV